MDLLIKQNITEGKMGLAAHIANENGQPLCKIRLNLADWNIQKPAPKSQHICRACARQYEKSIRTLDPTLKVITAAHGLTVTSV